MKIKLLSLVLIICFNQNISAQWVFVGYVPGITRAMSVADCNTVVTAGGGNGAPTVFRSTNGGLNWVNISGNLTGPELYALWALNRDTIFVGDGGSVGGAGGNAKIYRTYNGGITWTLILSTGGSSGFINGIIFSRTNTNFGIAQSDSPNGVGQPYWIAKTTDYGATWSTQNPPGISGATTALNSVICIDNVFYAFGLNAGSSRIDLTTDGGTNWSIRTLGIAGSFVSGLAASSDKIYMIAATNTSLPNISRSTNGGVSFSILPIGLVMSGYCTMRWIPSTSVCYLSNSYGAAGCIARSINNGLTWTQMSTSAVTNIFLMDLVYENGLVCGYAISADGTLLKLVENPLGIINNNNAPSDFRLYQNYPNPFNPATKIKFDMPDNSELRTENCELIIYDLLGNEIVVLINQQLKPGTYEIDWDGANYSSGTYFYKLRAGRYTDTKKLIILK